MGIRPSVTEDGRYLVITVSKGTDDKYRIFYKDLAEPYGMPVELINNFEAEYSFIGNDGPVFYFKTDVDAPRGKVIAMDIRKPARENWKELIPQSKDTLTGVNLVGNMFVATYLKDAVTAVRFLTSTASTCAMCNSRASAARAALAASAPTPKLSTPSRVSPRLRATIATTSSLAKARFFNRRRLTSIPSDYEVKQVFYNSKDGTRVPMFIVHRKGIKLDGNNPTLLYGYGGFNIPMTPNFDLAHRLA